MKVIDLLNKIANGEQPSHIRIYNRDWYWNNYDGYVTKGSLSTTPDAQIYLFGSYRLDFALDKEVEIIEEDKKIEKLERVNGSDLLDLQKNSSLVEQNKAVTNLIMYLNMNVVKINELVKAVNELKNKE
jgi:hypothetical protein